MAGWDPGDAAGRPGQFPYTRGVHPGMYRQRLWTMRQYAGFGTAESTNERFKFLLGAGQTGLSCAFDLPTQMGYDSDHPRAEGEVGKVGVAIDSLADMRLLLADLPLDTVTTSMTINATAAILLLLYQLVAEEQGVAGDKVGGTIQNDILKEYVARGTYIYPPRPSMRLIVDTFAYCEEHLPNWNTISISGYHIREAGSTAVQEVAFTLADGIAYVEAALAAGLEVDEFAPRLSLLLQRAQQPLRGGGQVPRRAADVGPHHDRALRGHRRPLQGAALPHPDRWFHPHRPAAREQHRPGDRPGPGRRARWHPEPPHQRLRRGPGAAHRPGRPSWRCAPSKSSATSRGSPTPSTRWPAPTSSSRSPTRSNGAPAYLERIDELGGAVAAIEAGFMQGEIEQAAYAFAKAVDDGEKVVVGVNKFVDEDAEAAEVFPIDPSSSAPRSPGCAGAGRAGPGGRGRRAGRRRGGRPRHRRTCSSR